MLPNVQKSKRKRQAVFVILLFRKLEQWFFVASYVVAGKIKFPKRNVDNDIPHWEGLEHVKNSLLRSRRSRDGII